MILGGGSKHLRRSRAFCRHLTQSLSRCRHLNHSKAIIKIFIAFFMITIDLIIVKVWIIVIFAFFFNMPKRLCVYPSEILQRVLMRDLKGLFHLFFQLWFRKYNPDLQSKSKQIYLLLL